MKRGGIGKDKRVTGLNGIYAAGCVPLLFLFAGETDPTLLENSGLILAVVGIGIDFRTARHMKRMKRMKRPDETTARSSEKKLFRNRWVSFVALRTATLSIAIVCGSAFAFGAAFMCWLHGPEWMIGCPG